MESEHVLHCFGQFGCVTKRHDFTFRVHEDQRLTGSLELSRKRAREENDEEDPSAEAWYRRLREPKYALLNGYAWKDKASGGYEVRFIIAASSLYEHTAITCRGMLLPRGLKGYYRYLRTQNDMDDLYDYEDSLEEHDEDDTFFELFTTQDSFLKEQLETSLAKVSPGRFSFDGFALTNELHLLSCFATLVLFSDGSMNGTIDETEDGEKLQTLKLLGTWDRHEIKFKTTSQWNKRPEYSFMGEPTNAGLRGTWSTTDYSSRDRRFESALFDLKLHSSRDRAWSETLNPKFPLDFRQGVQCLLMSSLRSQGKGTLPSDLWRHVLRFTSDRWFRKPDFYDENSDYLASRRMLKLVFGSDGLTLADT